MIRNGYRQYQYWKVETNSEYAQEIIPPADAAPLGTVKMAIFPTSTGTQDNILYANCAYVGFTFDTEMNDTYIIKYGKERLKVMYIQQKGNGTRQAYMKRVE